MRLEILDRISSKYNDYKVNKIESGASNRNFYRLSNKSKSVICLDSLNEKEDYFNFLKIHSLLSEIKVSIPTIYEKDDINFILIIEDFGNLRFDKILKNYDLKSLLDCSVNTLVTIKNSIKYDSSKNLKGYDYKIFKSEIEELPKYFYPYIFQEKASLDFVEDFHFCWKQYYDSINFDFTSFTHKDFNINNLMYLPSRKGHLKCGILDFQSAFWGESCWDLFSLLEDSRFLFDDQFNDYLVKYYFDNTNQKISFDEFLQKYYFLNCSRQTRLLGRWIKLSKELKQNFYLDFIETTKKRLFKVLQKINNDDLNKIYSKMIPDL